MHFLGLARFLLIATLALGFGAARGTGMSPWHKIDVVGGALTLTYESKTFELPIRVSPFEYLDDHVWFNKFFFADSPTDIEEVVEKQYGLLASDLHMVSSCDRGYRHSDCTGGGAMSNTRSSSTFTSASPFDYLAVHIGFSELLFHWAVPTSTFTLSGIPSASYITDYHAFIGPAVIATPLPGAALLFGSALAGLVGVAQRKKAAKPSA
jgi:hypothetical protein